MPQYLLLDRERKALNLIEWDGKSEHVIGEGVASLVRYDGVFHPNGTFDGTAVSNPNAPPEEKPLADGEAMRVIE
jgi:hypothetical protein